MSDADLGQAGRSPVPDSGGDAPGGTAEPDDLAGRVTGNAAAGKAGSVDAGASGAPASTVPARCRPIVGPQVRRLRQERSLTLAQVAQRSGLNVGYLSQIENDKALPSLEALGALAQAMDVPIAWFLLDAAAPPRVARAAERREWDGPGGVRVAEVDGGQSRDLRFVEATSAPGQRSELHAHGGDEHHLVLAGHLRLSQGPHSVELGPGDYLVWDASIPHDAQCIGDEPARVLIVTHRRHASLPPDPRA